MFTKTNSKVSTGAATAAPGARRTSARPAIPSIVSEGVHVSGNLVSDGDLQIDGIVDGDITGRNVTIGGTGLVTGRITAEDLTIDGAVVGEVRSSKVTLSGTASIEGDITHDVLVVAAGARFEGRCRRTESAISADESDTKPGRQAEALDPGTESVPEETVRREPASVAATAEPAQTDTKQVFEQLSTAVSGRRAQAARQAPVPVKEAD